MSATSLGDVQTNGYILLLVGGLSFASGILTLYLEFNYFTETNKNIIAASVFFIFLGFISILFGFYLIYLYNTHQPNSTP